MYQVKHLFSKHGETLGLELLAGSGGLERRIRVPEAHRPGLSLAGYLKSHAHKRILVLGKVEVEYLQDLPSKVRVQRLQPILSKSTPAVIVTRRFRAPAELDDLCQRCELPLFRSHMTTANLLSKLTMLLTDEFSPKMTCHGTFVEVFGIGVLIQGESAVGKSEAALGLLERGHRLIADDVVLVKKKEGKHLEGNGFELSKHHMEIRGIGIIHIPSLYGVNCVRESKRLDIVVKLEPWDDNQYYDRLGIEESYCDILNVQLPYHTLPVKPGRDVVLLLETIARNYRLKQMGRNAAKEFSAKVKAEIARKQGHAKINSKTTC